MSISKRNISDLLRDIKSGGDPTMEGKLHPTIIWKATETVFGGLIEAAMRQDQESNGYDLNGDWISSFKNVPVILDEDTDEMYSELPAQVISLKDDRGIHQVSEMKGQEHPFTRVANGSHAVFSILESHYLNTHVEYYIEGNRIVYRGLGIAVEKVLIKMVAGIAGLDPDSPIPIPASMEEELIRRVKDLLEEEKLTPQDKNNDTNPNKYQA